MHSPVASLASHLAPRPQPPLHHRGHREVSEPPITAPKPLPFTPKKIHHEGTKGTTNFDARRRIGVHNIFLLLSFVSFVPFVPSSLISGE
jgi:hypothetical protein